MSQETERVYTIPLGKVLLSADNRRAKRAINMIREFARRHMKVDDIRIDEEVDHQIWARGIRSPPRKIRVRMTRNDGGFILVSSYNEAEEIPPATRDASDEKAPEPAPEVGAESEIVKPEAGAEPDGGTESEIVKPEAGIEPEKPEAVSDEGAAQKTPEAAPQVQDTGKSVKAKSAPEPKKQAPAKKTAKSADAKKSKSGSKK